MMVLIWRSRLKFRLRGEQAAENVDGRDYLPHCRRTCTVASKNWEDSMCARDLEV
jgi:hypothetical protein